MSGAIVDSRKRSCSTLSTAFYVTSYVDQKFKVEAIQGELYPATGQGVSALEYALL
jgi:hypothetical protein